MANIDNYINEIVVPSGNDTITNHLVDTVSGYVASSALAAVAFSGDYDDLINTPSGGGGSGIKVYYIQLSGTWINGGPYTLDWAPSPAVDGSGEYYIKSTDYCIVFPGGDAEHTSTTTFFQYGLFLNSVNADGTVTFAADAKPSSTAVINATLMVIRP